ncbi:amino acid permease [Actinomadura kijaniata]|uniref:APA family basic amino acid/polyamine antiporter n=1 Tax=Actinomadura namibiensis TaxID=182080 RepID=A0A7W3LVU4_ACTNM|nr:amino acid permease [Actinomadura namibiensis]MBA8955250.1 APA family basic amino acid/polyamine antiporter [Actinomadura namibiensis]
MGRPHTVPRHAKGRTRTGDPRPRADTDLGAAGKLGLPQSTALVVGNIVGTGIFLLPASLAAIGTISFPVMAGTTLGAIALALVFGKLGARIPTSGGPYAYARNAFGEFMGFWSAWSFWLTAWGGNAGIAVAWVGYVNHFLHWDSTAGKTAIGLVGVWIPVLINLTGVRNIGLFQTVTTVLKFVPLIFVAIVGLFFVRSENFGPFNATGGSAWSAVALALGLILFIYSGMESVTIVAERVKDPARNVGRASVSGVLACGILYILATVAVFGTVPHGELARSTAPFADSLNNMFGGTWAGHAMAVCAIISGIGALNGWTMLVAEMPMAAARDGLFPAAFARLSRRGAPVTGILVGAVLTTLMLVFAYLSENTFNTILLFASFTTAIPYFFSAAAQLFWLVTGGRAVSRARMAKDLTVAVVALVFSFAIVYASGEQAVMLGILAMLVGVPVFIWAKARRGEYGSRDQQPALPAGPGG